MVELSSRTPFEGLLPMEIGGVTILEVLPGTVASVAPFKDRLDAVSDVLRSHIGLPLSNVGCLRANSEAEVIWAGLGQWFVTGVGNLATLSDAAVTDQSDAWGVLGLRGAVARDVLARLCPLDLRQFEVGQTARTEFAHMMSLIVAREAGYDIWVMRSFAQTALHHLSDAAKSVQAQSDLRR